MTGVIPLWLALAGAALSLFATGYMAGNYPKDPTLGTLATGYLGAWAAAAYVWLRYEGWLYDAEPGQQVFAALFAGFIVGIAFAMLAALLFEDPGESADVDEDAPAAGGEASAE